MPKLALVKKRDVQKIIKEEVQRAIHFDITLSGDTPFSKQKEKTRWCAFCSTLFHPVIWFQLYCSRSCGNKRRYYVWRSWTRKHT